MVPRIPVAIARPALSAVLVLGLLAAGGLTSAASAAPDRHLQVGRALGIVHAGGQGRARSQAPSTAAGGTTGACRFSSNSVCLTDSQLAGEVDKFVTAQGRGVGDLYLILTPQGVGNCFDSASSSSDCAYASGGYCAYHSWINHSGGVTQTTLYAVQPFADVSGCDSLQHPNNDSADDTINLISHEHNEAITDPLGSAWYDLLTQSENGDKCAWDFGTATGANGQKHNQTINTHSYYLQEEWSNSQAGCVLDDQATTGDVPYPQDATPLTNQGGPVMLTNRTHVIFWEPPGHSTSANYKSLIGQFLGDVAADSGKHTNVYSTDTQYTDQATGKPIAYSSTYAGSIVDTTTPYPPSFTFVANSPATGDASFTASPTGDQNDATYQWDFGDGQTGQGKQTGHHYAQGGTYSVKLTVAGSASITRQVSVGGPSNGTPTGGGTGTTPAPTASSPPATPPSPPATPAAVARLALPGQVGLVSSRRTVWVRVTCRPGAACRGILRLYARLRVGGRLRQVLIGTSRFSVLAGRTSSVRVTLSSFAGRTLAAHRRLTVTLRAAPTGAAQVARAITLLRP
jgi:hypothetical protein